MPLPLALPALHRLHPHLLLLPSLHPSRTRPRPSPSPRSWSIDLTPRLPTPPLPSPRCLRWRSINNNTTVRLLQSQQLISEAPRRLSLRLSYWVECSARTGSTASFGNPTRCCQSLWLISLVMGVSLPSRLDSFYSAWHRFYPTLLALAPRLPLLLLLLTPSPHHLANDWVSPTSHEGVGVFFPGL